MDRGATRCSGRLGSHRRIALIGAITVALLVLASAPWHITNWILTHWTFRYSDGFRGRALIGSLVGWLAEDPVPQRDILVISGTLIVLFAAACVWLIVRAWGRQPTLVTAVASICLLTGPGGLPFIALDLGRFDVVGLLLLMVALTVVLRWSPAASLLLIAVFGGVGVAVHEAFLVAQLPVILAAWWVTTRPAPRRGAIMVAMSLMPAAAVMGWIHAGATLAPPEMDAALARASDYIAGDFIPEPLSMAAQARETGDAMAYTWSRVSSRQSMFHRGVGLAACAPALLAGWHLLKRLGRGGGPLAAASFGPMALFVVGHDWGRWAALITLNTLIAGLWLSGGRERPPLATVGGRARVALVVAAVVSFLLPPVSPTEGLSADWYWDLVSRLGI